MYFCKLSKLFLVENGLVFKLLVCKDLFCLLLFLYWSICIYFEGFWKRWKKFILENLNNKIKGNFSIFNLDNDWELRLVLFI